MTCTVDGCGGEVTANEGGYQLHHTSAYGVPWPDRVNHAPKVTREDLERHLGAERVAALDPDALRRMTGPSRKHHIA